MAKRDFARLMKNEGIIRFKRQDQGGDQGGRSFWLDIQEKEPGGFSHLIWKHVDGRPRLNRYKVDQQVPAKNADERRHGEGTETARLQFPCGPVIVYAFAQAIGMVNDHIVDCHRHAACEKLGEQRQPREKVMKKLAALSFVRADAVRRGRRRRPSSSGR